MSAMVILSIMKVWGYDIASFIMKMADTSSIIVMIDDLSRGIRPSILRSLLAEKKEFMTSVL